MALHKCGKMLLLCFFVYTIIGGIDPVFGTHYSIANVMVNTYGKVVDNPVDNTDDNAEEHTLNDTETFYVGVGETVTFTCKTTKFNPGTSSSRPFSITWFLDEEEIDFDLTKSGHGYQDGIHDGLQYYLDYQEYETSLTVSSDHNNKKLSCQLKYDEPDDPAVDKPADKSSEFTLKVCSVGTEPCLDQSNCAVLCDNTNDCDDLKDEADCGQGPGGESSDSGDTSSDSGDKSSGRGSRGGGKGSKGSNRESKGSNRGSKGSKRGSKGSNRKNKSGEREDDEE